MSAFKDDSTKPSRLNRRNKKRWKIADLSKHRLTDCYRLVNLFMPLTHSAVGICTPFTPGHKMTAPLAVFLCLPFSTALGCVYSMVGCIGQPLKRLAAPGCGSANPIQPAAQSFAPFDGGLSLFTRMHRMSQNTHTQNPQAKTVSLFNIFLHRQLIASGIVGAKAERIKRRNPACIVKFSGFEGVL